jgi:hemoglobin-like flavoprotein
MNPTLLRSTWDEAQSYGDDLIGFFYTKLFGEHPELRDLFPDNMTEQRRHIHQMLNLVVRADNLEAVVPRLQRLGRDHRGYGAVAAHFPVVAATLLATFEHFLGDQWTKDAAKTWTEAITLVAEVMIQAAADADSNGEPFGWTATVYDVARDDDAGTATLAVAVADYPVTVGDIVPLSIPDEPGTRRMATVAGWAADGSLTLLRLPATDADPVALRFALTEPGDQIHLRAPLIDPLTEGAPHGR